MMEKREFSAREILAGHAPKDAPVTVKGWVRTRRDSKAGISFVHLSDGSLFHPLQVVAPNTLSNYTDEVLKLTAGCAVEATGTIVPSPAKGQPFEMQASAIKVLGWVDDPDTYPIQPKPHTLEFLREVAHLRPRTNVIGAATRVRHTLAQAIHRFFHENGYLWVNTPIITSSDAEGAGQLFRVSTLDLANLPRTPEGKVDFAQDFFGKETFLTVSGQLNVETYCMALSKVYTFGPTFRAENSNTSRHLAEFWMIEPEVAFNNLDDNMDLAEDFIQYVIKYAMDKCPEDLKFLESRLLEEEKSKPQAERSEMALLEKLNFVLDNNYKRVSYTEAIDILRDSTPNKKKKFQYVINEWGADLQSEHERYLVEKHFKCPVILFDYPANIKAFYIRLNEDGKTVRAMDILFPGIGEIVGGSQREERFDVLVEKMKALGIDEEELWWYLDTRRFGSAVHSGFGLGFERLVLFVTGMTNIRDVIPFPRTPQNAEF